MCPTEILAFSERVEEFREVNCEVLGCSTDTEYCHLAWYVMDKHELGEGISVASVALTTVECTVVHYEP